MEQSITSGKKKGKDINLKEIYKVIYRQIWAVVIITVIAAMVGYLKDKITVTPMYQASSRIIIGADASTQATLQVVVTDPTVLNPVIQDLKLQTTPDNLAKQISVNSINSTQVVSITVVDKNPKMAAQIANTTAEVIKDEEQKIIGQNNIRLLSAAQENPVPTNPPATHKIYSYTGIGLVIGIALAFFLDSLDNAIRKEEEIETVLGLTVLGKVSKMNRRNIKSKKTNLDLRGEQVDFK